MTRPRETVEFHFPDISRKAKPTAIRAPSDRAHPLPTRQWRDGDPVKMENETQKEQRTPLEGKSAILSTRPGSDSFSPSTYPGDLRTERNERVRNTVRDGPEARATRADGRGARPSPSGPAARRRSPPAEGSASACPPGCCSPVQTGAVLRSRRTPPPRRT